MLCLLRANMEFIILDLNRKKEKKKKRKKNVIFYKGSVDKSYDFREQVVPA